MTAVHEARYQLTGACATFQRCISANVNSNVHPISRYIRVASTASVVQASVRAEALVCGVVRIWWVVVCEVRRNRRGLIVWNAKDIAKSAAR